MTIANYNIASSNPEELLGVVIDSEVSVAKHIENPDGRLIKNPCTGKSAQLFDFKKAPLSYENICFFPIKLLSSCMDVSQKKT